MGKETAGKLSFTAPNAEGSYDFRMNSDSAGVELTSIPFAVARTVEAEVRALRVPEGSTLQASIGAIKSAKINIRDKANTR
jgi:hypothetical protein